jgi:hypothetical protein
MNKLILTILCLSSVVLAGCGKHNTFEENLDFELKVIWREVACQSVKGIFTWYYSWNTYYYWCLKK